ncbi:MAG: hypothetical protein NDI94_07045 [Candidatus Woesearchaeota archaeon]|nr:hypothetical protein [Candidatus Woesearchaeota archaeon]
MEAKKPEAKPELKPMPAPAPVQQALPDNLVSQLHEIMRRIRLLEERYSGLRKKTQFTEQNMLKDSKELYSDINGLQDTISEIKNEVADLTEKMEKISEEVKNGVNKNEFNVIAKYMNYWQPMNFLTRKEAEKIINEFKGQ